MCLVTSNTAKNISFDEISFKSSIRHENKWYKNGLRLKRKHFILIKTEKRLAAATNRVTSRITPPYLLHKTGRHNCGDTEVQIDFDKTNLLHGAE